MSKKGGYKIVSLGGLDLTGEDLALSGLYNALKLSYGKPILLSGIVIDGEKMKDIYVTVDEDTDEISIKHVYGYNLTVDDEDAITVEEDSENISLPVPTVEDDEKILGVNVEGKYVLKNPSLLPYVRKMDAPTSTTLTDEQINLIKEGMFINGTFLGYKNPVLFPADSYYAGGPIGGFIIGQSGDRSRLARYTINNKVIGVSTSVEIGYGDNDSGSTLVLKGAKINFMGKDFPAYPDDAVNTYTLKLVAGVLTWVQDA